MLNPILLCKSDFRSYAKKGYIHYFSGNAIFVRNKFCVSSHVYPLPSFIHCHSAQYPQQIPDIANCFRWSNTAYTLRANWLTQNYVLLIWIDHALAVSYSPILEALGEGNLVLPFLFVIAIITHLWRAWEIERKLWEVFLFPISHYVINRASGCLQCGSADVESWIGSPAYGFNFADGRFVKVLVLKSRSDSFVGCGVVAGLTYKIR